jgi:uncharacterized protein (DUF427 family)
MAKAPGYEKWPQHRIREQPLAQTVTVELGGELIASSNGVVRVDEDKHPVRYYFPRADVPASRLQRSATASHCPFKGEAHYFDLVGPNGVLKDAVWSYEQPFDEHAGLKDRLAFYDDKYPELVVRVQA